MRLTRFFDALRSRLAVASLLYYILKFGADGFLGLAFVETSASFFLCLELLLCLVAEEDHYATEDDEDCRDDQKERHGGFFFIIRGIFADKIEVKL